MKENRKVNLGFFNRISNMPFYTYNNKYQDVYDICENGTGKIIAFATSRENALEIIDALNVVNHIKD